jgi:predicted short-subunit dehydrogenase-like oxidoreductase (DUF2520 family)
MKVTIIGTGNIATHFAKLFYSHNICVVEIVGRNKIDTIAIAKLANATPVFEIENMGIQTADIYIIAVADKAIETIANSVQLHDKVVVHTAASVSINVLLKSSNKYGVLYPIQSIRKDMNLQTNIPFLIDANNEDTKNKLANLAAKISKKISFGGDDERLKLHVAAVFVCNFVNYLYLQASNFCNDNQIEFSLLQPLIEETATRLNTFLPKEVFTGPAVRKDLITIEKHLEVLKNNEVLKNLYQHITNKILEQTL